MTHVSSLLCQLLRLHRLRGQALRLHRRRGSSGLSRRHRRSRCDAAHGAAHANGAHADLLRLLWRLLLRLLLQNGPRDGQRVR